MNFYYSDSWFKTATDFELETEREKVREAYANAGLTGLSIEETDDLYWLLNKFDNEMGERAWAGEEKGFPVYREHGWYLPSDD